MIRRTFNYGWQLIPNESMMSLGPVEGRDILLPFDGMPDHKRSPDVPSKSHTGYFPDVVLTCVKQFDAPADWADKWVVLEFEAAYTNSMVYINDDYAGSCPHGYTQFYVEANRFLKFGQQNLVKIVCKTCKDSRWYTGVGPYRNTKLMVADLVHIIPDSYRVSTPEVDDEGALVQVAATLTNKGHLSKSTQIVTTIFDAAGNAVCSDTSVLTAFPGETQTLRSRLYLKDARRWDVDDPYLYTAKTQVLCQGEELDADETAFGVRTLALDAAHGLRVNGRVVKLRGACVHHDNGVLGAAAISRAEERRVELLKAAGFNAIRSAHNPISKAFLDACDKHGMLVMDEISDMWTRPKCEYDYASAFPWHWQVITDAIVGKNFNHPSVVMYSIGNEILENGTPNGAEIGRKLAERVRALDDTRYVINSANIMLAIMKQFMASLPRQPGGGSGEINEAMTSLGEAMAGITNSELATQLTNECFDVVDIAGYNYATDRYLPDGERFPNRVLCGSETFPAQIAENWALIKRLPHVIGDFTWTGWDYLGEAGIAKIEYKEDGASAGFYGDYPWYIGYCGDLDIIGNRRPVSYYREIVFGLRAEPYISAQPPQHYGKTVLPSMWYFSDTIGSWTFTGHEGKPIKVEVYADADRVELLLNGAKAGEAEVRDFRCEINTTYQPGELVAVAYKDGRETGRSAIQSATGQPALRVEADRTALRADDTDLAYLMISLVGENGVVDTSQDKLVRVTVEGAGTLAGLGSARPNSEENFRDGAFTTFGGYVLAVVRPTQKGAIKVTVQADGLTTQTVELKAE